MAKGVSAAVYTLVIAFALAILIGIIGLVVLFIKALVVIMSILTIAASGGVYV